MSRAEGKMWRVHKREKMKIVKNKMPRFLRLDMDKFQTFLTHCFCILSRLIYTFSPATTNK